MKSNLPARARARIFVPAVVLAAVVGLGGCSKSDSNSTDVTTTEAAATEPAATEAPATEAPATEAPVTEAAAPVTEAPVTEAAAPATEPAGSAEGADAAGSLKVTLISEMMKSMNNGAPADQKDIDCVSDKVSDEQVSALMASAAGGGGMSKDAVPVLKAMFSCKPKGLTDSFIASSFDDMPAEVTADQKTCMADKFFDFIATNDEIMTSIVADASKPPAEFKAEGAKIVKECVPSGAAQDKLIAELNKE